MNLLQDAASGVRLRPLSADDAALVVRWRNQPDIAGQMFQPPPASEDAHRRWFEAAQARGDRHEFVIEWGEVQRAVGTIGLSGIDRTHGRAEYGILIGEKDARGRGVARAASALIVQYAFQTLGLQRLVLHVLADNAAAIALYHSMGFRDEGRLRQHHVRGNERLDVLVMGLLRSDSPAPASQ